jgi:hypothetical protein
MFKIIDEPEFTHEVKVLVPVDGGHQEQSFKTRFRVVPLDELEDLELATSAGQETFLRRVVVRFDDIVDAQGQPMPQSDELTNRMLATPYVRTALFRAYTAAMTKARVGN